MRADFVSQKPLTDDWGKPGDRHTLVAAAWLCDILPFEIEKRLSI